MCGEWFEVCGGADEGIHIASHYYTLALEETEYVSILRGQIPEAETWDELVVVEGLQGRGDGGQGQLVRVLNSPDLMQASSSKGPLSGPSIGP